MAIPFCQTRCHPRVFPSSYRELLRVWLKLFGSKKTGSSGDENLFGTEKSNFSGSHSKSEWFIMKNFCRISRTPNNFTQTRESLHANDLIPQSYREETPHIGLPALPKHWHFTMKNVKVKNGVPCSKNDSWIDYHHLLHCEPEFCHCKNIRFWKSAQIWINIYPYLSIYGNLQGIAI